MRRHQDPIARQRIETAMRLLIESAQFHLSPALVSACVRPSLRVPARLANVKLRNETRCVLVCLRDLFLERIARVRLH